MTEKKEQQPGETREFEENPFNPENRRPEDVVRLFYTNNVPIVPVISKRGILIGVLKKEDVISELSDLERARKLKIDDFITRLAKKMTMDELLPYGGIKEFVVINIFGETQETWSRLRLFTAADAPERAAAAAETDTAQQKEEQVLEWMIYLILEHIPRALYAVNTGGRTIFYNSHFEEIYRRQFKKDVDVEFVEQSMANGEKNELLSGRKSDDLLFFNSELKMHYEKIPLMSKRKKVGFLFFCSLADSDSGKSLIPGVDIRSKSLDDIVGAVERMVLVDLIQNKRDLAAVARSLKISQKSLMHKVKKHGIKLKS